MNRNQRVIVARKKVLEKAEYWLALAEQHNYRREHYQELCDYKMAASYFFELRDGKQLRQIFKECPDVKSLLSAEIVEFAESEGKMDDTQFLLFKKLVEVIRSQEARIRQLEEQIIGHPTDLSEDVEELNQLIRELLGVHFPESNCDRG